MILGELLLTFGRDSLDELKRSRRDPELYHRLTCGQIGKSFPAAVHRGVQMRQIIKICLTECITLLGRLTKAGQTNGPGSKGKLPANHHFNIA